MSSVSDSEPEGLGADDSDSNWLSERERPSNSDRSNYGRKGSRGPWAHLDKDTKERYEAIEQRIRDKVRRGEL